MRNIFDLIKKKDEEEREWVYDDYINNESVWESTSIPQSDDDILIATDENYDYYLKTKGGDLESTMILRKNK